LKTPRPAEPQGWPGAGVPLAGSKHRPLSAPLLMIVATLLFALMGVCVKLASRRYGAGEIVMYRSLVGLLLMAGALRLRRLSWRTPVPGMHFWRSVSGVCALCLWFYAIGNLPLATAMTLNYMSSVWVALFLLGGSILLGPARTAIDGRLFAAVLAGFCGVALVLRPTLEQQQLWHGLMGLLSGLLSAMAYLQITALGRVGEPGERVVLYFALCGLLAGCGLMLATGGPHTHDLRGGLLLAAIGLLATTGQWMITRAWSIGSSLSNATLQYLGIVYSFIFGIVIFDDRPTWMGLAGMLLIIGAGIAATRLRQRAPQADAPPTES
jgi:S-adenosylmethionine uptake transporter